MMTGIQKLEVNLYMLSFCQILIHSMLVVIKLNSGKVHQKYYCVVANFTVG